jgi:hypothetical protein
MTKQRCYELPQQIRLTVGRKPNRTKMPHFKTVTEEPMSRASDRQIVIAEHIGTVRKVHWFKDADLDETRELVCGQTGRAHEFRRCQRDA